jgi:Ca2+-binding RTX toxin-like protein
VWILADEPGAFGSNARYCHGEKATIVGTPDIDSLGGTQRRDVIVGGKGIDAISGGPGNDVICSGSGFDVISGDAGNDRLYSGRNPTTSTAASGRISFTDNTAGGDMLNGQGDFDRCWGGTPMDDRHERYPDIGKHCERLHGAFRDLD